MVDKQTISVYDSQVKRYLELVKDESVKDQSLLKFISHLNSNDYVLDLGCGPGQASSLMREYGLMVDPIDASFEMVNLANKTYDIGARQAQFNDLSEVNKYNGVWASFSLLHATAEDFPKVLRALHTALKPNGLLHLGMKLGCGSARDKIGRLYTYYTQDELCVHLADAGFTVSEIELGEGRGMAGTVDPWITILSTGE